MQKGVACRFPPEEISNFATTVALPQIELSSSIQSACPLYTTQERTFAVHMRMSASGQYRPKCNAAKCALTHRNGKESWAMPSALAVFDCCRHCSLKAVLRISFTEALAASVAA